MDSQLPPVTLGDLLAMPDLSRPASPNYVPNYSLVRSIDNGSRFNWPPFLFEPAEAPMEGKVSVRFVRLATNARIPLYATPDAAGADLNSCENVIVPARGKALISTGLSLEIPSGHYGRIAPRSGLAAKHAIDVGGGVIDSDCRGELKVLLFNFSNDDFVVKDGDRIAQLICEKISQVEYVEAYSLNETVRGTSGFGSTVLGMLREDWQHLKRKWYGVDPGMVDFADTVQMAHNKKLFVQHERNQNDCLNLLVARYFTISGLNNQTVHGVEGARLMQRLFNKHFGSEEYRIHVFEKIEGETKLVWAGSIPSLRNIVVFKDGISFTRVDCLYRLFRNRHYCLHCTSVVSRRISHVCDMICRQCSRGSLVCKPDHPPVLIHCDTCGMSFSSRSCHLSHLKAENNGGKRCGQVFFCKNCRRYYNKRHLNGEEHECGQTSYCFKCRKHCEPTKLHTCYTPSPTLASKKKLKEKQNALKIIVYDFECMQYDEVDGKLQYLDKHEVVCVAIRKACYNCFELDMDAPCAICIEREKVISYKDGPNVLELFVDWLIQPVNTGRVLFAHYGGRYDNIILMDSLVKRGILPTVILRGCRILTGRFESGGCAIEIRDSYNLIPIPLAGFKSTFGLACPDKGEFPFLWIRRANFGSVSLGLPPIESFQPDGKSPEKRKAFLEWYHSYRSDFEYVFDDQLVSYCKQDTVLLLLGLVAYRNAMMTATGYDPLSHSPTIASFTQLVLRHDHIPPNTLTNVPEMGYNFRRQASDIALTWLKWTMQEEGVHIQHLENGGEKSFHINGHEYFVDGWTEPKDGEERGTIREFQGCFWHGCDHCFRAADLNRVCNTTYGSLRANTEYRLAQLRQVHNVITVWECAVRKEMRENDLMKQFFDSCQNGRLLPRNAMSGGRTEAFARVESSSETHRLVYYDVNSLYPTVMYEAELPVGMPEVITSNFPPTPCRHFDYKGIAYISIVPPKNLRYALLGVKMHDSFLFILCKACAQLQSQDKCRHSDAERAISGCWTHLEIRKALDLGYVITHFYELWTWKEFSNNLFKKYIQTFFKIKTESSGWPQTVKTEEDRDQFVEKYLREMNIIIDRSKVSLNQPLRNISKLLLNTAWGKYAESPFLKKSEFVDADGLFGLLEMRNKTITNYKEITKNCYLVTWKDIHEEVHSTPFGNIPIAAFITSSARLRLYQMLEASNEDGLYVDTDSIIALIPRNANPFSSMIGDSLGQLTDETPGKEIVQAVLAGNIVFLFSFYKYSITWPKQYCLSLMDEETGEISYMLKLRGVVMDFAASQKINFDSFYNLVMGINSDPLITKRMTLKRKMASIQTVPEQKAYVPVNRKGFKHSDHRIYPFGYERPADS